MALSFAYPRRHIVNHLDFERNIVLHKIKSCKSFLFHQDIAFPIFVKHLNQSLHPQTKSVIVIDKIIQVIRETMFEIAA